MLYNSHGGCKLGEALKHGPPGGAQSTLVYRLKDSLRAGCHSHGHFLLARHPSSSPAPRCITPHTSRPWPPLLFRPWPRRRTCIQRARRCCSSTKRVMTSLSRNQRRPRYVLKGPGLGSRQLTPVRLSSKPPRRPPSLPSHRSSQVLRTLVRPLQEPQARVRKGGRKSQRHRPGRGRQLR